MRIVLFLLLCSTSLLYCQDPPTILVSIPAYKTIVQDLAGECATVRFVIPPGVSFHTYEPRPRDIEEAFSSILWFYIGDPFEEKIINTLASHNAPTVLVDLRYDVPLITQSCCTRGADPHIWLDPRLMKKQLYTIAGALKKIFPGRDDDIDARLAALMKKMDLLIEAVDKLLRPMKGKAVVVSHGAYTYLCREYGFSQLSIEKEGKEPSLASFTALIKEAQAFHIKKVFSIKQYPKTGIERVADILGATIVELDPYTEDYLENMLTTAQQFYEAMNEESVD